MYIFGGEAEIKDYDIGQNINGKVMKARHIKTNVRCVIKYLLTGLVNPKYISEYQIQKRLRHANVVRLLQLVKDRSIERYAISMEPMDFNLKYVIESIESGFTENHIRYILHQIVKGLSYIHGKNIIHRDITPSNILVNKTGRVKIADFATACDYEQDSPRVQTTEYRIRTMYRAPEILLGKIMLKIR